MAYKPLSQACAELVAAKNKLDAKHGIQALPMTFISQVLPFANAKRINHHFGEAATMLSPNQIIGCNWRGHKMPDDPEGTMLRLDTLTQRDPGHREAATVIKVGPFPLYLADQGKCRVRLYQHYQRPMNVRISQALPYPAAESLTLLRGPLNQWWLRCTDREALRGYRLNTEDIAFPEITVPLLKTYGVAVKWVWQFNDPVYLRIRRDSYGSNHAQPREAIDVS